MPPLPPRKADPAEFVHPNGKRRKVMLWPDFVLEEVTPGGMWWLLPIGVAVKPSRKGKRPNR